MNGIPASRPPHHNVKKDCDKTAGVMSANHCMLRMRGCRFDRLAINPSIRASSGGPITITSLACTHSLTPSAVPDDDVAHDDDARREDNREDGTEEKRGYSIRETRDLRRAKGKLSAPKTWMAEG